MHLVTWSSCSCSPANDCTLVGSCLIQLSHLIHNRFWIASYPIIFSLFSSFDVLFIYFAHFKPVLLNSFLFFCFCFISTFFASNRWKLPSFRWFRLSFRAHLFPLQPCPCYSYLFLYSLPSAFSPSSSSSCHWWSVANRLDCFLSTAGPVPLAQFASICTTTS